MTAISGTQFGTGVSGTDTENLFLKQYLGSIAEAPRSGVFLFNGPASDAVMRQSVTSGKSWQFLMEAQVPGPEEYTPGDDLLGQAFGYSEGTITSDRYLVVHAYVRYDDLYKSHWKDVISRVGRQHRRAIDLEYDARLFRLAGLGARTAASNHTSSGTTMNVHQGGNLVRRGGGSSTYATSFDATYSRDSTGANRLIADIRRLARLMDEDNIAPDGRKLILSVNCREVLQYGGAEVFSRDYVDGQNNLQMRQLAKIENFEIVGFANTSTNNGPFPTTNVTTGPTKYQGNFSLQSSNGAPVALAYCRGMGDQYGIGMVNFEEPMFMVKDIPEKKVVMLMGSILGGANVMHPWCLGAIELTSDTANTVS